MAVPFRPALPRSATTPKTNDHELSGLIGRNLETVYISIDCKSAIYVTKEQACYAYLARIPVGSTVSAEDSVIAAFAYTEDKGLSLEDTLHLTMATGVANVMNLVRKRSALRCRLTS